MDWDTLKAECLACRRCELCTDRTHVVFGQGVQTAEVLFVGEGPGQSEDEQGLPFVGRSGQLLDKYLYAIDLIFYQSLHQPVIYTVVDSTKNFQNIFIC